MTRTQASDRTDRGRRIDRTEQFERLSADVFDVLVVGGGINGAVSAAALTGHGARVALVDRGDFAGFTSSSSSNLAWGGIKYLETYELGLVRKLCRGRNELLRAYPSAVREIRFYTTLARGGRYGRWLLYFAALLYWAIGGFFTRRPRLLSNGAIEHEERAIDTTHTAGGLEYSDAYFVDNDAHFVFRFVRDALERGAVAVNYAASEGAHWDGELWHATISDSITGRRMQVRARAVINACGPHVEEHNDSSDVSTRHRHVFSKGVHLIVPRITAEPRVLTFFASDGRLFFVIPMGACSSIGTTDTRVDTLPAVVTAQDRAFILSNINARLRRDRPLTEADVIAERCGVRPLVVSASEEDEALDPSRASTADWTALSRKHALEIDLARRHLSIFGGKLTDCLNVGKEVVRAVARMGIALDLPDRSHRRWYGEAAASERAEVMARARALGLGGAPDPAAAGQGDPPAERLWRRFGPRVRAMLDRIEADPTLAEPIVPGADVLWIEAHHAARHELVTNLEDFLRRRTRLAQVVPRERLSGPTLERLARVLFGADAKQQLQAWSREGTTTDDDAALPDPAVLAPRSTSDAEEGWTSSRTGSSAR